MDCDTHTPLLPIRHAPNTRMKFARRCLMLLLGSMLGLLLWWAWPRPVMQMQTARVRREGFTVCFGLRMIPPVHLHDISLLNGGRVMALFTADQRLRWGEQCLDLQVSKVDPEAFAATVEIDLYARLSLLRLPFTLQRTFKIPREVSKQGEHEVSQVIERGTESMLISRVSVRTENLRIPFALQVDHLAVEVRHEGESIGRASVSELVLLPGEEPLMIEAKVVLVRAAAADRFVGKLSIPGNVAELEIRGTSDPNMNELLVALLAPLRVKVKVPALPDPLIEAMLIENPLPTKPIPASRLQVSNPLGIPILLERIDRLIVTESGNRVTALTNQAMNLLIPAACEHYLSEPIPNHYEGSLREAWQLYRRLRRCEMVMMQMEGQVSVKLDHFPVTLLINDTVPLGLSTCSD